ncbi:MAG: hypothetical protein E7616_02050 [Ruminococcaceae bacterium]|nr:hypothetical protein [Oscillospiraceae bacterium]
MKKITALILCAVVLLTLASCGGEMPEKTPEPATPEAATPEAQTPEAVTPEESYPKEVKNSSAMLIPAIVEYDLENEIKGIKLIQDTETLNACREEYKSMMIEKIKAASETDSKEQEIASLLKRYEQALKFFSLCEDQDYFEDNAVILIGLVYMADVSHVNCRIILDESGNEKLKVSPRLSGVPNSDRKTYTLALSLPKDIAVSFQDNLIVSHSDWLDA